MSRGRGMWTEQEPRSVSFVTVGGPARDLVPLYGSASSKPATASHATQSLRCTRRIRSTA